MINYSDTTLKIQQSNPFNLEACRLPNASLSGVQSKKLLTQVRICKPSKEWYFRVHPDRFFDAPIIDLKEDGEQYLIGNQELAADLLQCESATCTGRRLVLGITRQGLPFIWPLRLPKEDGNLDPWSKSALDASDHAQKLWTRMISNRHAGFYEINTPVIPLDDPVWPTEPFEKLMEIAWRNKIIQDCNHPILKRLRGEI